MATLKNILEIQLDSFIKYSSMQFPPTSGQIPSTSGVCPNNFHISVHAYDGAMCLDVISSSQKSIVILQIEGSKSIKLRLTKYTHHV